MLQHSRRALKWASSIPEESWSPQLLPEQCFLYNRSYSETEVKGSTQKANLIVQAAYFRNYCTRTSDLLSNLNFTTTKCTG